MPVILFHFNKQTFCSCLSGNVERGAKRCGPCIGQECDNNNNKCQKKRNSTQKKINCVCAKTNHKKNREILYTNIYSLARSEHLHTPHSVGFWSSVTLHSSTASAQEREYKAAANNTNIISLLFSPRCSYTIHSFIVCRSTTSKHCFDF